MKIGGHTKGIIDLWTVVFANVAETPERRVDPKFCNTCMHTYWRLETVPGPLLGLSASC